MFSRLRGRPVLRTVALQCRWYWGAAMLIINQLLKVHGWLCSLI